MTHRNKPKDIFDNPDGYLDFLSLKNDRDFENQYFDRKEAPRKGNNGSVRDQEINSFKTEKIIPTLSGFANQNHLGGLLILGITTGGDLVGLNHLTENQINSIAQVTYLVNHRVQFKIHEVLVNGTLIQL